MGDVADILGEVATAGASSKKSASTCSARKPQGMSREVFQLIGPDALPPLVPSSKPGKETLSKTDRVCPWKWAPFKTNTRRDNLTLHHWQRGVVENVVEYAFARFNKKCFVIEYSDAEYAQFLVAEKEEEDAIVAAAANSNKKVKKPSRSWSREECDHMILLCNQYDLRWPVIADRWEMEPRPSVVELKERYYKMARLMLSAPIQNQVPPGSQHTEAPPSELSKLLSELPQSGALLTAKAKGAARLELAQFKFDVEKERVRVQQLNRMFTRSREQEAEEAELLKDLQRVEMRLKRLEKEQENQLGPSKSGSNVDSLQRPTFYGASGPDLQTRRMYLRSARLHNLPTPNGIGPRLVAKLNSLLNELDVPVRPMPTGLVCNAYDKLRQDAVKLLSLQRHLWNKRRELAELSGVPLEVIAPVASSVKVASALGRKKKVKKLKKTATVSTSNVKSNTDQESVVDNGIDVPKRGRPVKAGVGSTKKRKQSDAGISVRKKKKSS